MTSTDLQILVLQTSASAMEFTVNWFIQSSLLIAVGIAIARLFQRHGSAVQSVIYRTTLTAVLVCPLATMALSILGISGWSIQLPTGFEYRRMENSILAAAPNANRFPDTVASAEGGQNDLATAVPSSIEYPPQESVVMQGAASADAFGGAVASATNAPIGTLLEIASSSTESTKTTVLTETGLLDIQIYGIAAMGISLAWILIGVLFLWRLAAAWRSLGRLRCGATEVEPDIIDTCQSIARQMVVTAPQVLRTPYLPSPCLAGIRRPAVLLPEQDQGLPMRDILVHELAHLRRHDCHWNLLRRLATAVFFFQPLLWWLSRLVESTAEEVCDDHVVKFGGDRSEYANRLVDVAELCTVPAAPAGVGIVSVRSMLARRVDRIMDRSRTLSTRIGNLLLVLVIVGGLIGTAAVGLIGLESSAQQIADNTVGEPVAIETESNDSSVETLTESDHDSSVTTFTGTVVDPNGKPVGGAELYFVFQARQRTGLLEPTSRPVAVTSQDGTFRFTAKPEQFCLSATRTIFKFSWLVAAKPGYGFAWSNTEMFDAGGKLQVELRKRLAGLSDDLKVYFRQDLGFSQDLDSDDKTLRLVKDDVPIRGRIVDTEGRGVAGAKLTLLHASSSLTENLDAWREAAAIPGSDFSTVRMKTNFMMHGPQVRSLVKPATTDSDGRFTISGVGRDRLCELLLTAPRIESTKLLVRTESGEPIALARDPSSSDPRKFIYYPAEFLHVAGPSTPIVGVVRDSVSQIPLAGITVKSLKRHGDKSWGEGFVRAVTDEQGRYRLDGMPVGGDNYIAAMAPDGDVAYLSSRKQSATEIDQERLEVDFDLPRGVWVSGRITDLATKKGLAGWFAYYASKTNPHRPLIGPTAQGRGRFNSNADGKFRIAVSPGPGHITFVATNARDYPRANSVQKLRRETTNGKDPVIRMEAPAFIIRNCHLVAEIDPQEGSEMLTLDLQLDRRKRLSGRVVDADGKPVNDYYFTNKLAGSGIWDSPIAGKFELLGYNHETTRYVGVVTTDHRQAGYLAVTGQMDDELVVELQPAGRVKGRLIDANGEPLGNHTLYRWQPDLDSEGKRREFFAPSLPRNLLYTRAGRYETDGEGNFEITGLVPEVEYRISAIRREEGKGPKYLGPVDVVIRVESGQSQELGDVQIADPDKFQAEALKTTSRPDDSATQ